MEYLSASFIKIGSSFSPVGSSSMLAVLATILISVGQRGIWNLPLLMRNIIILLMPSSCTEIIDFKLKGPNHAVKKIDMSKIRAP